MKSGSKNASDLPQNLRVSLEFTEPQRNPHADIGLHHHVIK